MNSFTILLTNFLWIHFCISNHPTPPPPPKKKGYGPSFDLEEDEETMHATYSRNLTYVYQ